MNNVDRHAPRLLGFAAAAALVAGGLVLAAPAAAHPEHADGQDKTVTRVVVISHSKGQAQSEGEGRRRVRILDTSGDGPGCDRTEAGDPDGREKTKVIICGDPEVSAADRAARLEKALGRIQQNDQLSADHKARVTAALQEAIERLRNTR